MSEIKKFESEIIKTETEEVSKIKSIGVAHDEEKKVFLLGFNRDEDSFEKIFMLPADRLKDVVMLLFQAGMKFQSETNIDIGFGTGESKDDE